MKQLKFKFVVASSLIYGFGSIPKANKMIRHPERYTEEECYRYAIRIMRHMKRKALTRTKCYGVENLPKEGGYIMYSNHQGKYDALGILIKHKPTCAVLWEEKSADRLLARQICGLLRAQTISFEDPRQQIKALNKIAEEVSEGRRYLIFPEGGYTDNKNNLQEFKSGCFACSLKSKAPIIPVAIYDSWKSMDINTIRPVTTQVHFMEPIYYEEYGHMKKKEISDMVKGLIQKRIDDIRSGEFKKQLKNKKLNNTALGA
ncbi:MAG: 1-acyl-sn-glycerol-3-phosphate acyltransferase [Lachnospiraceae bacterium]|nr:1-acyl-sn-glycerol-3-phosphate acyltransferase [Lachnospiraceae bacterium]MBR1816174.1 1-acyl-sn-glycerol-3-phosphate acyltransferase [Lachnospiraceae bacterium]